MFTLIYLRRWTFYLIATSLFPVFKECKFLFSNFTQTFLLLPFCHDVQIISTSTNFLLQHRKQWRWINSFIQSFVVVRSFFHFVTGDDGGFFNANINTNFSTFPFLLLVLELFIFWRFIVRYRSLVLNGMREVWAWGWWWNITKNKIKISEMLLCDFYFLSCTRHELNDICLLKALSSWSFWVVLDIALSVTLRL